MTAIIGVLNKSAIAVAADSAVSVGNTSNRKVYNNANKIFNLLTGSPVAIMVYNNAEFLGVPWETVIKMYRKERMDVTFNTIEDCKNDFITFIKQYFIKHKLGANQITIKSIVRNILGALEDYSTEELDRLFDDPEKWTSLTTDQKIEIYKENFSNIIVDWLESLENRQDLIDLKTVKTSEINRLINSFGSDLINEFWNVYQIKDKAALERKLKKLIVLNIKKDVFKEPFTGLVFTGYGEEEIFPSLYSIEVGGSINDKLRYANDRQTAISNNITSSITPFAQTDIMRTFIEGTDPSVKEYLPDLFESTLHEFRKTIVEKIDESSQEEKNLDDYLLSKIPQILDVLKNRLTDIRERFYIRPMLAAIGTLSKEDLADLAESLINLTYLKKRVSFDEESVGGPVDVAIITKGDGFIWVKRKHYFDPHLNPNYFK